MGLIKEFREFALKGNVIDLAVGVIIAGAFTPIVHSLVNDVIMPPIGLAMGGVDFADKKIVLKEAVLRETVSPTGAASATVITPEVAISYGRTINLLISFFIIAFCVFLIVKAVNNARRRFEQAPPPAPPAPPSKEEVLLAEIRDILKKQQKA